MTSKAIVSVVNASPEVEMIFDIFDIQRPTLRDDIFKFRRPGQSGESHIVTGRTSTESTGVATKFYTQGSTGDDGETDGGSNKEGALVDEATLSKIDNDVDILSDMSGKLVKIVDDSGREWKDYYRLELVQSLRQRITVGSADAILISNFILTAVPRESAE